MADRQSMAPSQALQAAWNQPAVSLETRGFPTTPRASAIARAPFAMCTPSSRDRLPHVLVGRDGRHDRAVCRDGEGSDARHEDCRRVLRLHVRVRRTGRGCRAIWRVGHMLRSPHIDFIMAPSSYFDRNLPGKPYFRVPVQSLALHGKMFWNDFDQVSFKYYDKLKADPNLKTWEYQMGLTRTPEEFVWMNRARDRDDACRAASRRHTSTSMAATTMIR